MRKRVWRAAALLLTAAVLTFGGAANAAEESTQTEELQQTEEPAQTEEAGQTQELQQAEKLQQTEEAGQSQELQQAEEAGQTEELQQAEELQQTEEPAQTEELQQAEASGNTEKGDEDVRLKDAVTKELDCYVGAAVTAQEINNRRVWDIITTHFNAVTLGNELKPDALFNYSNAVCPGTEEAELNGETIIVPKINFYRAENMLDKILQWNKKHPDDALKVRGHVLVWHAQTPEWFFHEDYDKQQPYVDKETMNKRLEWYIRTVLTHFTGEDSEYRDLFYGWDVVNEAVSDATGTYRSDSENPDEPLSNDTHGNNSSWWHVYQSNEFILNAFIYANRYAPSGLELYYNDYNECSGNKMMGILELLRAVKATEGARIDAMGMQGHYNMDSPGISEFEMAIRMYAKVVGNVQITEFDMKASEDYDGTPEAKEKEFEAQAKRYGALYWMLKSTDKEDDIHITSLTFWGTADHLSWLQSRSNIGGGNASGLPECPLLFDEHYQKKPAFYAFTGGAD